MPANLDKGAIVEAIADHDGSSKDKDELSFSRGDKFRLLKPSSEESWWHVQSIANKKKGFVPSNLVFAEGSLDLFDWCHGAINRSAAEFLLMRSNQPGSFLVRESQSKPGDYTLSLYDGKVAHYRINEADGQFFIRHKQTFNSIPELIEHHRSHSSGLPMPLSHIVQKAHASAIVISKKMEAEWELKRDDVSMGKMLGAGNYGEVYKGNYKNLPVAIKTVKEESMGIEEFMREAQVMKKMQHPNLVQLIGVCSKDIPMYIVTEFIPHGDMLSYLRRPESKSEIDEKAKLHISTQVADGMAYLERHNCIHRDLAARNCLVADKLAIKIADFGMGRVIDDLYTARTGSKMPVKWSAPESLCYNAFSSASDVWSFGILLWEVATLGGSPYPEIESKDVLTKLEEGYRMDCPSGCNKGLYKLMYSCWAIRAEDRPKFAELKVGLEKLLDEHSNAGSDSPAERPAPPVAANAEWRESYEKSSGPVTPMMLQQLIDMTKEVYAKSSNIVRYGEEATFQTQLQSLLSSAKEFLESIEPLMSFSDVKTAKKSMETAFNSLNKGKFSLSKAKPTVEKLRNATRDMNKHLKSIRLS
eukprot:m.3995 g.3995  ORF g.3995 m.3995 type:complete len:586 (-) comp2874_c0_seq1:954-2711(-)